MNIFNKPIDEINENDIDSLIQNQIKEDRTLDYKSEYDLSTGDRKREFLYDICSFANSEGGFIIYGIRDEKLDTTQNTGIPEKIIGLNNFNSDHEFSKMNDIIRMGVEPRIIGIKFQVVNVSNNKSILIIKIPKSFHAPHMVKYKGTNKFYSRSSTGKYPMDVMEIKNSFLNADMVTKKAEAFRLDRLNEIKSGNALIPKEGINPCVVLHILPIFSESIIDIAKSGEELRQNFLPMNSNEWSDLINFEGYCNHGTDSSYTQVYRNGIIESVCYSYFGSSDRHGYFFTIDRELEMGSYLAGYISSLKKFGISDPFHVSISILNARGYHIHCAYNPIQPPTLTRDDLILPSIEISDEVNNDDEFFQKLCPLFNIVWNAFGIPQSPNFDEKGNLKRR